MKWSDLKAEMLDDKEFTKQLDQLAGSALAVKIAVKEDMSFEGILSEFDRMKTIMSFLSSHFSVKVLSNIQAINSPKKKKSEG